MTRKDYEKAAEYARTVYRVFGAGPEWLAVKDGFLYLFRGSNPRFDAERFVEACK